MLENVYEGLYARKCIWRLKCLKIYMKASMLENVYEGLNAQKCIYTSAQLLHYFCTQGCGGYAQDYGGYAQDCGGYAQSCA